MFKHRPQTSEIPINFSNNLPNGVKIHRDQNFTLIGELNYSLKRTNLTYIA